MGKYNSSVHRVRPLMEKVVTDARYLEKILELVGIRGLREPQRYWYDGVDCDCKEKQLKPSKSHLEKLIRYISEKDFDGKVVKNEKRRRLCGVDDGSLDDRKNAMEEALLELENGYDSLTASSRAWYVFEGFTNPDIFVEGDQYVIVCEGKWTEPHITTQTTNLLAKDGEYRNQMIRHIQGALNYTCKEVYAFYIVDEGCGYLDDLTCESFKKQLSMETIEVDNRDKIEDAFKGYITWQDIEKIIPDIKFKTIEELK